MNPSREAARPVSPQHITRIVTAAGLAVAIFIALATPITFAVISTREAYRDLQSMARLSAARAARYIFANERLWEFQRVRLEEVIELPGAERQALRQAIRSVSGREVYADDRALAWPVIRASEAILVAGREVGVLEVETSAREIAIETIWVAVRALLVAVFSLVVVHLWPLRLIRRMLDDLGAEQRRTQDALGRLKASDRALQARSHQLLEAQKLGLIGDWSLQLGTSELFLSPVGLELLRVEPGRSRASLADFKAMVARQDTGKLERLVADVLRRRAPASIDVEVRRGDGTRAYLAVSCRPVARADGGIAELAGTIQDITDRRETQTQLEHLAYFDTLTGLANRALFKREVAETLERLSRSQEEAALLLLDLDRFKEVNDSLGHGAGDELLRVVARSLGQVVDGRHFVARLGGDEFAIIVAGPTDRATIAALAQSVVDALGRPMTLGGGEVRIGASIGIVMLPRDGAHVEEVTKHADLALYRAKDVGRGRYAFFEPTMSEVAAEKMALARDLRVAAMNNGLEAWFQPKVEAASGRVVGFEALLRWNHPERGYVPPAEFVPVAESSSLITDIGQWILQASVRQAKAWLDAGHPPYQVAVNISAAQFWQSHVEDDIAAVLAQTGLPPGLLCVELTESLLVDHADGRVRRALTRLHELGVVLALDDFGTGFSSLGYLVQLPFDVLKIDRIFVDGAARSERMCRVLEGVIALGHGLGMTVVAEGVEDADDLALLRRLGCDQVQGFIYARPAPADEAIGFAAGPRAGLRQVA